MEDDRIKEVVETSEIHPKRISESDQKSKIFDKYGIDLKKLENEQEKLAKNLSIKDSINFELAERVAGIDNIFFKNRIISAIVVLSDVREIRNFSEHPKVQNQTQGLFDFEIVEQEYFEDKVKFPYIPSFRAYRELPAMISAFNKLDEKPDVVFIRGHGILHPKGLGIASHFSLVVGVPCIGIADNLIVGEVKGEDILLDGKSAGKIIKTKFGARPLYISPGNMVSVSSAEKLTKIFTKEPHRIPEPLRLARRYAKEIMSEIFK